ncbi:hypothetical protein HK100_006942, partial [Physocladia obscura]
MKRFAESRYGTFPHQDEIIVHLQGPYGKEIRIIGEEKDIVLFYVGGTGLAAATQAIDTILARNTANIDAAR